MAEAPPRVPGVEARAGKFPGPSLIPALNAIQERVGWLPREELVALSRDVHRPLYEIEGLVSFYPHFRTDPPKTAEVRVCHDLSCWLRGADVRIAAVKERYGSDADVEVVEASCLGRCDIAPAGTVNEVPVPLEVVLETGLDQNPQLCGRTTLTRFPPTGMPCSATCSPAVWRPRT
jgi:formate dehydrogenase beta subunit